MSRREFLLAGAGLAVVAACGGGGESSDGAATTVSEPGDEDGGKKPFNLVVASFIHVTGIDERVAFAFLNEDASGPVPIDGPVELSLDGEEVEAAVHDDGVPLPYLLVRHRFPSPKTVMASATYRGATQEAPFQVVDPATVPLPVPGGPMISTPSPTPANPLGVDPICTRDPACPLHEVSLDAALAEKRPLAVLFSTPARCQSRLCGPVLDNLLAQRDAFADQVRFLHVEIYAGAQGAQLSPTVAAYSISAEPILYLAGADGIVSERIDNVFDRVEARSALERLTG